MCGSVVADAVDYRYLSAYYWDVSCVSWLYITFLCWRVALPIHVSGTTRGLGTTNCSH